MNISKVKLRDAILRLVVERDSAGLDQPDIEDSMSRSFLEISPEDVDSALQWLKARELVAGIGTWGGPMLRIQATAEGEDLVESGTSVAELIRPNLNTSSMINVNGQNVQFNQGDNVQMTQSGLESLPTELQNIVDILKQSGYETAAEEVVEVHRKSGVSKAIALLPQKISEPALVQLGKQIIPLAGKALELSQ